MTNDQHEREIVVADFTDAQQAIVRRVVDDLQRIGTPLRVTFTHRRKHICVGGTREALEKMERFLGAYASDGAVADRHRRFALRASLVVRKRLADDACTCGCESCSVGWHHACLLKGGCGLTKSALSS